MNWIDEIVRQHEEVEAPRNFWKWAAICAISAAVKDNVWLDRQIFNIYPNIYVMLHADSGLRKGPPVALAKQLVEKCNNTLVISGRSSIQGILKDLGNQQSYTEPGGKVVTRKSTAFICSSELTSSIVEDKVATTILTDLFDRQYNIGQWRSLLKMETFDLKSPTITMLTATNEAHSADFFARKDIIGGYFARTFIIYENKKNRPNSLSVPLQNPPNIERSAEYLKKLSNLKGIFQPLGSLTQTDIHTRTRFNKYNQRTEYFSEAGYLFEEWYEEFSEVCEKVKDPTGTLNRFDTSVLKVAMILSLSKGTDLIIDSDSMQEAINTCETLIGNIRKVTLGKTGQESPDVIRKTIIIQEFMQAPDHVISRARILKKYWMQGNYKEWDECLLTFVEAGAATIDKIGDSIVYRMINSEAIDYEKFFKGKMK